MMQAPNTRGGGLRLSPSLSGDSMRFVHVDIHFHEHMLNQPIIVGGVYSWHRAMGGDCKLFDQIKSELYTYDIIFVGATKYNINACLLERIHDAAPDATIVVSMDHSVEQWGAIYNLRLLEQQLGYADMVFCSVKSQYDYLAAMDIDSVVMDHPFPVTEVANYRKTDIEKNGILILHHAYEDLWVPSFLATRGIDEETYVLCPSNHNANNLIGNFTHVIPPLDFATYIKQAASMKYAIDGYHLVHSVGRFQIDNACLGIPTVGVNTVRSQVALFPELATDPHDARAQRDLMTRLVEDREFYIRCKDHAAEQVKRYSYENRKAELIEYLEAL